MAAWFTIYSPRSLDGLSADGIADALRSGDLHTDAEGFGIEDDDEVYRAVAALRVEALADDPAIPFAVSVKEGRSRPLLVHRWTDPARVREEIAEAEEYLAGRKGRVSAIRAALSRCIEVAAVELGLVHLEGMGLVIAGQVAEHLASVGNGLILDTNDEWWTMRKGVPVLLLGR
ncbi:MAG: hypothetical protein K2W96_24490 [Gemmataceae bacterium]|nr:hypothetical protein [Gemmataceae bacterium]